MLMSRFGGTLSVSHLDIDAQRGLVWVIDVTGSVWFTTGVSAVHPEGSGCWWQVQPQSLISVGIVLKYGV